MSETLVECAERLLVAALKDGEAHGFTEVRERAEALGWNGGTLALLYASYRLIDNGTINLTLDDRLLLP